MKGRLWYSGPLVKTNGKVKPTVKQEPTWIPGISLISSSLLLPSASADGPKLSGRPALAAFFPRNLPPLQIIEKGQWGQNPTAPVLH